MRLCMFDGCSERATHVLKMIVPDAYGDEPAAEGLMGIEMCFCHAAEAEDSTLNLIPPLVAALANVLRYPSAVPDTDGAYLSAIGIDSAEAKAFLALEPVLN